MKKLKLKIVSLLIGLLFSFLVGEVICRVDFFGSSTFSYSQVNSFRPIGKTGFLQAASNGKVFYELRPNLDVIYKLRQLKTNAHGLRDQEHTFSKNKKTIRGAIIGDSFTMATGVEAAENYHSLIESILNEGQDSIIYELINFGVSGYNLLNYEGVLEDKIMAYDPDFVMISYCGLNDDMLPNPGHVKGKYHVQQPQNAYTQSYMWKLLELKIKQAKRRRQPKKKPNTFTKVNDPQTENEVFINSQFARFKGICDSLNLPLIMPYLSIHAKREERMKKIQGYAFNHQIPFVSSLNKFEGSRNRDYYFHKYDGHPDAKAHALFAEAIMESVAFQQLLRYVQVRRGF